MKWHTKVASLDTMRNGRMKLNPQHSRRICLPDCFSSKFILNLTIMYIKDILRSNRLETWQHNFLGRGVTRINFQGVCALRFETCTHNLNFLPQKRLILLFFAILQIGPTSKSFCTYNTGVFRIPC